MRVDPTGLWSPEAHDSLFDSGLGTCIDEGWLTEEELNLLKTTSRLFDLTAQQTDDSYKHFMRTPNMTPGEAKNKANEFINEQERLAREASERGDRQTALIHFAKAAHVLQDMSSPAHVDVNGDPKVWDPPSARMKPLFGDGSVLDYSIKTGHSPFNNVGTETSKDITPKIRELQDKKLREHFQKVFGGES
jgi:hypothetical protein